MTDKLRFPARFDAGAFREDMAGTTPAGQSAAEIARRDYEANGVPVSDLRPCDSEGRDGTVLPRCLKLYVPPPWVLPIEVPLGWSGPRTLQRGGGLFLTCWEC